MNLALFESDVLPLPGRKCIFGALYGALELFVRESLAEPDLQVNRAGLDPANTINAGQSALEKLQFTTSP